MNVVCSCAPRSVSTIIFTVMPLYTRRAVRMLTSSGDGPLMLAAAICPNDRVRGSFRLGRTGGGDSPGSARSVSPWWRCRGWGACMSAHLAVVAPSLRHECGTPIGTTPKSYTPTRNAPSGLVSTTSPSRTKKLCSKACTCPGSSAPGSSSQIPNPVCTAPTWAPTCSSTTDQRRKPAAPGAQSGGPRKRASAARQTRCRDGAAFGGTPVPVLMCTPPFSGVLVVPDTVPDELWPCQVQAACSRAGRLFLGRPGRLRGASSLFGSAVLVQQRNLVHGYPVRRQRIRRPARADGPGP